jgi:hypothetical protein
MRGHQQATCLKDMPWPPHDAFHFAAEQNYAELMLALKLAYNQAM